MNTMTHPKTALQPTIDADRSSNANLSWNSDHEDGGRLLIISGSLRENRVSSAIASWVADGAAQLRSSMQPSGTGQGPEVPPAPSAFAAVSVLNLDEIDLPDDRLLIPGGGPRTPATETIDASDAFVFVSPEYNHSYPAGLKRFVDWHYSEWAFKAATIVGYGARGGYAATEHLRGIFAELSIATTRRSLGLVAPWTDVSGGDYHPGDGAETACIDALAELAWWSKTLRIARRDRPFGR